MKLANKKKGSTFLVAVVLFLILMLSFIIIKKTINDGNYRINDSEQTNTNLTPSIAVFMRNGEIWIKNYDIDKESKISKATKVTLPHISPNGKYITYSEITHDTGGFPTNKIFINNIDGKSEYRFSLNGNNYGSKLMWSGDDSLLGLILFPEQDFKTQDNYGQAYMYDPAEESEIFIGDLKMSDSTSTDSYMLKNNSSCNSLKDQYKLFCNKYINYLKKSRDYDNSIVYKRDKFSGEDYVRTEYKLLRSEKLMNGLVVLEYYTGKPQNPESNWDQGSFVPGYDTGTTETYTLLIDEASNTIIDSVERAVGIDYYFK